MCLYDCWSAADRWLHEESWELRDTSVDGLPLAEPFIAFRRRKYSGRLDHISHLAFFHTVESIPPDYHVLKSTISGNGSGYLRPWGYLAIKRASIAANSVIDGDPLILDIAVARQAEGETIVERYSPIERENGGINPYTLQDVVFMMKTAPAMGICDLSFKATVLDRYPIQDSAGIPLPEDALPEFIFPKDMHLVYSDRKAPPLPVFFTFVFTDQVGKHFYVACLQFYEEVAFQDISPLMKDIWQETKTISVPEESAIYCPKVICVLSRYPFYRAMRRFLRQIYSISMSSNICPIEYFIGSVVGQIPLPVEGGRPFHVVLDAALISASSKPMGSIAFSLPPPRFFPLMDLDFACPLRCLSVDVMLAVFTLMLRESKLVFVSFSNAMLTETMETLRILLFPLTWSSCFVTRLPTSLNELMQVPGGCMIGIHLASDDLVRSSRSSSFNYSGAANKFIQSMHLFYPIHNGSYIIDLTSNSISLYNGRLIERLSQRQMETITKDLPSAPALRLRAALLSVADNFKIGPQTDSLFELDSALDLKMSSPDTIETARKWDEFPTLMLRDAFMSFMADLLGDYTRYIIPPTDDLSADTYRTFVEEFKVVEYLSDADSSRRKMLEYIVNTQMFSVLQQHRSESTSQAVVFFEEAASLQCSLGLNLVPSRNSGMAMSSGGGVCELPKPLCVLLEAEYQWSCLTKTMQQQTLQRASLHTNSKSHSLSVLSHSFIRALTSATHGIAKSSYPIQNQHLLDLLSYIDFTQLDKVICEFQDSDVSSGFYFDIQRKELDREEDLRLDDELVGSLVLPGPVNIFDDDATFSSSFNENVTNQETALFSYNRGWPQFNYASFENIDKITHRRLKEIKKRRFFSMKEVKVSFPLLLTLI